MPEQQQNDLTTPESAQTSRQVYDRIVSGECKDAPAELNAAHGRES